MRFILALLLLCLPVHAATYYVAKTGSDAAAGGSTTPWLTIGKAAATVVAGDTVIIGNGDYDEHVYEQTAGSVGNLITYQAQNAGLASLRAFRLGAAYIKLDGLKFTEYSGVNNSWGMAVRIEVAATDCIVTSCTFTDYPYVLAHDFTFDSATNKITSASSNFVDAGFVVGSKVYLGASGATINGTPLYYNNHDTTWTVASVATTYMTLTNGSAAFQSDTGTDYWAFVRAGTGSGGFPAVGFVISGGSASSNCTISNNTVTDWPADAFDIKGSGHIVEENTCSALKSFKFCSFSGSNHIIRRNIVKNSPNVIHYTPTELDTVVHPAGTGWYDYVTTIIAGFTTSGGNHQSVLIQENWFEDVNAQLGRVDDELVGAYDITYERNVFIGISAPFSGGRDQMRWLDNTFYKCAFDTGAHPLALGGRPPAQSGYELSGNLFVACGPKGATQTLTRGYYSISGNATTPTADGNFVTSEEVTGYAAKTSFAEATGVNGGDPVFYNVGDPMGADDLPFTSDDGLKVLANSPAAALGGGALGVRSVVSGQPVAHFRVSNPTGWFEPLDEAYDPEWLAQLPTERGALERPYDTPVVLGSAGVAVTFNAEKSISGVGGASTNTAITTYLWQWGDGTANTSTTSTTATHTFSTAGDFTVTLTVTNSAGATHSTSQEYRILGDTLNVPSEYLTIQAAVDAAQPGDTIRVSSGTYPENVLSVTSGTSSARIVIEGVGLATMNKMTIRHSYITLRNMRFTPADTQFNEAIWMRRGGHFARIEDCYINTGGFRDVGGIEWEVPSTQPFGTDAASDCVVTGCEIENGFNEACVSIQGDRNVVENCIIHDGTAIDFLRLSGRNNVFRNNYCYNNFAATPEQNANNHADFVQCFARNGFGSKDHIIENNVIRFIENGQLTQFEGNLLPDFYNWTIRNNLFIDIALQSSCTIPGIKYYNNTFYRCNFRGGHALTFGRRAYNATNCAPNSPELANLGAKVSGELVIGRDYEVSAPVVTSGNLVNGVVYRVEGGSTGFITYDGVNYTRNQTFTAGAITTFTASATNMILHRNATVTHDGVTYYQDDTFTATTTTFTTVYDPTVNGIGWNEADDCEVKNNVFLACGDNRLSRGWYSFDTLLEGVSADFNYVAKEGFGDVAENALLQTIGGGGGWDNDKWYEPNGVNGGDPRFVDFSIFDFRLLSDSILIDAGDGLGVLADRAGVTRPNGGATDIGAYEYDFEQPITPPVENDPLVTPTGVLANAVSANAVTVTWVDASANETFFEVARSEDGAAWVTVAQRPANSTSWNNSGLQPETLYYYRVRAYNATDFSEWSESSAVTTQATPPTTRRFARPNGSVVVPP